MAGIIRNLTTAPQGQKEGRMGMGQGLLGTRYTGSGTTEPTVIFLLVLVVLEMVAYGALRYTFKNAHGG